MSVKSLRERAVGIAAYLFGRDTMLGLASLMLLVISGYATWHGMQDFVTGVTAPSHDGQAAGVSKDVLVIAVVVALTFLMWLALRETFGAQRRLRERLISFPLYLFLAIWSVGFGYGFWWSLISGEEATRSGLVGLQEDARGASALIAARVDAVRSQLDGVVSWSESQMSREEKSGGSCGVASNAGRGPLYNARRSVHDSVDTLRQNMARSWFAPVQADLAQLQQSASQFGGLSAAERQRSFEAEASGIREKAQNIATRSNEQGKLVAAELRALADTVSTAQGAPGFACYDLPLAQRLKLTADEAVRPAELQLRAATFSEGPAGVAHAIKALWANIGDQARSLSNYVMPSSVGAGVEPKQGEPLTGRDLIALLAAIGVDLGLLALTALSPPPTGPTRRDGLAATQANLHLPTDAALKSLRAAIGTAIMHAPNADFMWVRRHFIHHDGASYFVIPNLFSVDQQNVDEELRALAINQLAGVLVDLNLIRGLTPAMLKRLGKLERQESYSDLARFQDKTNPRTAKLIARLKLTSETAQALVGDDAPIMRNHGLLSKAQRALDIAGWSVTAQQDVEIFRVSAREGIMPLLSLLGEVALAKDSSEPIDTASGEPVRLQAERTVPALAIGRSS